MGTQVCLFVFYLLAIYIDDSKLIFLEVARASDSHGSEGHLFVLFDTYLLTIKRFSHSLIVLSVVKFDPLLETSHVKLGVKFPDTIKSFLLYLQVVLIHPLQVYCLLIFHLLLLDKVRLIGL